MKLMRAALIKPLALGSLLVVGCSPHGPRTFSHKTIYLDRNGDGIVDMQQVRHKHLADADSDLRDDDFDGRYETKVVYGVGVFEEMVDFPVPTGVRISR